MGRECDFILKPFSQSLCERRSMSPVITKLEGARRQLDCAVRLFFDSEDALAIHTLSRAAFRVLFDLYPRHLQDGFLEEVNSIIERAMGWRAFNLVTNFLKHADKDPDDTIPQITQANEAFIGIAAILYSRLSGRYTPEMRAFDDWMKAMYPEAFPHYSVDPEFDRVYAQRIKEVPHEGRLIEGKAILNLYRNNPDHPRLDAVVGPRPEDKQVKQER
jgi:hypothetical protein